jgi:hypothetical protein
MSAHTDKINFHGQLVDFINKYTVGLDVGIDIPKPIAR